MVFDGCEVKKLATQDILTYFATRTLPYHLYADESELLGLTAPLTSVSLSKKSFLTDWLTFLQKQESKAAAGTKDYSISKG